ncbi:basic proline-rich protein-like [Mustela putorius furo]|uniref:Basic proline-rich protein-like n=1 Tax=Mustela putorius furo TaxID=9669 RepID=A0A8U0S2K8_MUSPF|nr:basic proline-rich protein-like [Mustela putorius furo]
MMAPFFRVCCICAPGCSGERAGGSPGVQKRPSSSRGQFSTLVPAGVGLQGAGAGGARGRPPPAPPPAEPRESEPRARRVGKRRGDRAPPSARAAPPSPPGPPLRSPPLASRSPRPSQSPERIAGPDRPEHAQEGAGAAAGRKRPLRVGGAVAEAAPPHRPPGRWLPLRARAAGRVSARWGAAGRGSPAAGGLPVCGGERGRESARTCRAGSLHPHRGPGACPAPAAHLGGPCRHLPPWGPGLAPRGARRRPPPHSAAAPSPLGCRPLPTPLPREVGGPRRALVSPQGGPAGPGPPSGPGHPRCPPGRECLRPSSAAPPVLRGQRRPSRGRRGERSEPALRSCRLPSRSARAAGAAARAL